MPTKDFTHSPIRSPVRSPVTRRWPISAGTGFAFADFLTNQIDTANVTAGSSYTFSSVSFGAADANRYLLIGINIRGNAGTVVSAVEAQTSGGSTIAAATSKATHVDSGTSSQTSFWLVPVSTADTNGRILVTIATATSSRAGIGVWRLQNPNTTATATATATATDPLSLNVNCNAGGAVFVTGQNNNVSFANIVNIGGTDSTNYAEMIETSINHVGGFRLTSGTPVTTEIDVTATTNAVGVAISFAPA